ncbi:MAG: aminotransferase class IV [Micropruina sp.]|uniref:aminotransferase class IV n=1 Tax=Micropruina sp. TaxID=2737536 RepID=UPI0039E393C1
MRTLTRQLVAVLGRGVVPTADPIATADDVGLVRGDGCFDAMRVLGGGPDAVVENRDAHLDRFAASAATLDLPFDTDAWRTLIGDAVAAWAPAPEAVLKLVLTRGPESTPGVPTGFLTITELDLAAMAKARAGIAVRTMNRGYASGAFADAPWLLGGAKLLSYAVNAASKRAAARFDDDDALFVSSDGYALEGPTSAVIVLRHGVLTTTPPGVTGILDSVTARQILAGAAADGVPASHELIRTEDLFTADGVWLASSIRGVCPVVRLDGQELAVDADWNRRITDWGGFGGLAAARDELRYAVSLHTDSPDAARRVRGLVAARCRAHIDAGGTVDQLAVDLGVSLAAASQLANDEWPDLGRF